MLKITVWNVIFIALAAYFAGPWWALGLIILIVLANGANVKAPDKIFKDPYNLEERRSVEEQFKDDINQIKKIIDKTITHGSISKVGSYDGKKIHKFLLSKGQDIYEYSGISNKSIDGKLTYVPEEDEILLTNGLIYKIKTKMNYNKELFEDNNETLNNKDNNQ